MSPPPQGAQSSRGHATKNSFSGGPGSAGLGSGYGPGVSSNMHQPGGGQGPQSQQQGILRGPSGPNGVQQGGSNGPPGAAGGFKFGSPSQIPGPGSPPYNNNMSSPNGIGGPGLPPLSTSGPPIQGGPGGPSSAGPAGASGAGADRSRTQQVVYPWSQRPLTMNPPRFLDDSRQAQPGAVSPSPFPRYGHAVNSVASNIGEVYLFGGLVRESVKNDLYVINAERVTQPASQTSPPTAGASGALPGGVSATLVQTTGEIPPPRVGHATVLVANVLILWGGDTKVRADDKQDEGLYLLNLSSREWTRVRPSVEGPNAGPVGRYGHTVSIVGSRFFVFGGQVDGTFMNDLWSFDLNSLKATPQWEMLQPTTELPPKRTGHASVMLKDKIYIFGGTDGQYHYNDTWCYDITTNVWKELSCIGYIPVPREGHAACLVDDVMYIFGGRGVDGKDLGDLASFRISNQRWYMFANMGPSPTGRSGHALTAFQNKVIVLGGESFTGNKPDDPAIAYVLDTAKIKYPPEGGSKTGATPSSARKSGAEGPGSRSMSPADRAVSPTQRGAQQESLVSALQRPAEQQQQHLQQQQMSPSRNAPPANYLGATSPNTPGATYTGPRSQHSLENIGGASRGDGNPASRGANGMDRTQAMSPTAHDGLPYGGVQPTNGMREAPPQASAGGLPSVELDALRRREAWMKTALALAVKKGFVVPEELSDAGETKTPQNGGDSLDLDDIDTGAAGSEKERMVRALITLKSQLALAKSTIAQQAQSEADRIGDSDRARMTALQEAAFFRAKMEALESGNTKEADRLQRERNNDIERQLSDSLRETSDFERQISRLKEEVKLEQQLRSSAEERLSEASKRAMAAESAQLKMNDELGILQKRSHTQEAELRNHREKTVTLTSLVAKHQSENEEMRGQMDEHRSTADRHVSALRDLQSGLGAATARASEHERMHFQHRDLVQQHELTISRLRSELNAKSDEADGHASRATELESLVARHREEADAHRTAVSGGLAQLLAHHKQQAVRGTDSNVPSHVSDRLRALQEESDALRQNSSESKTAADRAQSLAEEMRERNQALERQQSGLQSELSAMRSQLAIALQEVARLKDTSSGKDVELRDARRQFESSQVKHGMLRQFMGEHGLAVPSDDEMVSKSGFAEKRVRSLEEEVDAQARQIDDTEHRLRDALSRVEELTRELEHAGSRADRNGPDGSTADAEDAQRRASLAERELQEAHATYRDRTAQLENDYQTAVQFVKGSEKMLRRMKDELTRYKTENGSLQNELMNARSGVYSPDNAAAKDVEALRVRLADLTSQHDEVNAENRDLERRVAALIAEHKDFRDKNRDALDRAAEPSSATSQAKVQELETQVQMLDNSLANVRRELQETLTLNTHLSNELTSATKESATINGTGAGGAGGSANLASDLSNAQRQNQQLRTERENLTMRLQETEDKLQLLLGRVEAGDSDGEGGGLRDDDEARDSHAFSISSELDKWERDRAGIPDGLQHTLGATLPPSTANANTGA